MIEQTQYPFQQNNGKSLKSGLIVFAILGLIIGAGLGYNYYITNKNKKTNADS